MDVIIIKLLLIACSAFSSRELYMDLSHTSLALPVLVATTLMNMSLVASIVIEATMLI